MRVYPGYENWPENTIEAHKMLLNAWMHLRNREAVEFETLEARQLLNTVQLAVLDLEAA